tara:strand:+ start:210 stop:1544 length:1335 start_codon:yes stop_codon:yes gene_type:complete
MATVSETLLALNEVLEKYDTEVKSAGPRVTTLMVRVKERSEAREKIKEACSRAGIKVELSKVPGSTFEGLRISESVSSYLNIVFKPQKGGGSGAGAAVTKMAESAQAVYAAVAFGLGREITHSDITPDNVKSNKDKFDVDEDIEAILNELPDDWIESSILGANELWNRFKGIKSGIKFHRGSKTVDHIENQFKRIKKIEGVKIDINKWSPADIYVTTPKYDSRCLEEEKSIKGLNQCMNERINPTDLKMFGVSLKKMSRGATLKIINYDKKDSLEKEYSNFSMKPDSIDTYLNFTDGTRIQFRSFGGSNALTGWQGEVKGSKANQGKISLGPINTLLKMHGVSPIDTTYAKQIKSNQQKIIDYVVKGLEKYATGFTKEKFAQLQVEKTKKKQFDAWLYSKVHCIAIADTVNGIKNSTKRKQVCEDFYLYANSKSSLSSPYWKLE